MSNISAHPRGYNGLGFLPAHWRLPMIRLLLAWAALAAVTWRDWADMIDIWWSISTYGHILFVPVISVWLVYLRKDQLAAMVPEPRPWFGGLLMVGASLFIWLVGSLGAVSSISHLGAVLALQSCVFAILGLRAAMACAFPLAFLIFLVPFGGELVPALQMLTAQLVILLTELSGIPAVIDGVFIDTPVGLFEVAESCSGVKFLIAMVMLAVLICYCCFTTWQRRALFMIAAIILPIIANGIRAWGTIYIAQYQGIEFAAGFDHIFYGWVFFALIVAGLLGASWRFFDRTPDTIGLDFPHAIDGDAVARLAKRGVGPNSALFWVLAMAVIFALWAGIASQTRAQLPKLAQLPQVEGWQQVQSAPEHPWAPRAGGADIRLMSSYVIVSDPQEPAAVEARGRSQVGTRGDARGRSQVGTRGDAQVNSQMNVETGAQENVETGAGGTTRVDVFLALYDRQDAQKDASGFGEGALVPDSEWRWLSDAETSQDVKAEILTALGRYRRRAETSYHIGGLSTGSASRLKLAVMRNALLMRREPVVTLIISAQETPMAGGVLDVDKGAGPEEAAQRAAQAEWAIAHFRKSLGDEGEWIDRIITMR